MHISFAIVPFRPAAESGRGLRQGGMETRETGKDGEERTGGPIYRWWASVFVAVCPKGWTTASGVQTDEPYEGGILQQRVCGRRGRSVRPGRSPAGRGTAESRNRGGAETLQQSRATPTADALPMGFPSLRAH